MDDTVVQGWGFQCTFLKQIPWNRSLTPDNRQTCCAGRDYHQKYRKLKSKINLESNIRITKWNRTTQTTGSLSSHYNDEETKIQVRLPNSLLVSLFCQTGVHGVAQTGSPHPVSWHPPAHFHTYVHSPLQTLPLLWAFLSHGENESTGCLPCLKPSAPSLSSLTELTITLLLLAHSSYPLFLEHKAIEGRGQRKHFWSP